MSFRKLFGSTVWPIAIVNYCTNFLFPRDFEKVKIVDNKSFKHNQSFTLLSITSGYNTITERVNI